MRVFHSRFGPAVSKKGIGRFGYAFQKAKEVCLLKTAPDRRKGRGLLPIGRSFQKAKEKPPFRTTSYAISLARFGVTTVVNFPAQALLAPDVVR